MVIHGIIVPVINGDEVLYLMLSYLHVLFIKY